MAAKSRKSRNPDRIGARDAKVNRDQTKADEKLNR